MRKTKFAHFPFVLALAALPFGGCAQVREDVSKVSTPDGQEQNIEESDIAALANFDTASGGGGQLHAASQYIEKLSPEKEEAWMVIRAYYMALKEISHETIISSNSRLPYTKYKIKEAILYVLPLTSGPTKQYFAHAYLHLAVFQDLRDLPFLTIPEKFNSMSEDKLEKWAREIWASGISKREIKDRDTDMGIELSKYIVSAMNTLARELKSEGL